MPRWFAEYLLHHQRIDIDEAQLEQMQRQHCNLLVFAAVGRKLSAFAIEDEAVDAIPMVSST